MALTETQHIENLRRRRPGRVRISQAFGGSEGNVFRIELSDPVSGVRIALVEVAPHQFGVAMAGGEVPCDYRLDESGPFVGKRPEHKRVEIFVPDTLKRSKQHGGEPDPDDPVLRRTLAPYEVSGWTARMSDLLNSHNWTGQKGNTLIQLALAADLEDVEGKAVMVTFFRYVDPDTGEPVKLDGGR